MSLANGWNRAGFWLALFFLLPTCSNVVFNIRVSNELEFEVNKTEGEKVAVLLPGYISVVDADAINSNSDDWNNASTEEKENALSWGRVYIDAKYSCTVDPDNPSAQVQYANALFGDYYLKGELYPSEGSRGDEKITTAETVKAGSVEVSESFAVGSGGDVVAVDPFPNVSQLLLQSGCVYKSGNSSCGTVSIQRAR